MSVLRFAKPLAALLLGSLLLACGPSEQAPVQSAASTDNSQSTTRPDPARFLGQALQVLDASEQQLDGAATLVVTFSVPLLENQPFAERARVSHPDGLPLEQAWELSADGTELRLRHLPPSSKLTLVLDKELEAITGTRLDNDYRSNLETSDMEPMVGFASRGSLLPAELAEGLPVLSLNVNDVDVDFYRINDRDIAEFVHWYDGDASLSVWSNDHLQKKSQLVYSGRFDLQADANTQHRSLLPIRDLEPLQQPGLYLALMRQAGHHNYHQPSTLFSLSDIGLSLHAGPNGQYQFFTLGLADGKPLSDVEISLFNRKGDSLGQTRTDAKGQALLQANKPSLVIARRGNHTTLLPLKSSALDLSEFTEIQGPQQQALQLFVFSPRDLYRPGETLHFNALLRDSDGRLSESETDPQRPLEVEISTPEGELFDQFVWSPTQPGFYQHSFKLPDSAPTGRWQILVRGGDAVKTLHELQVEDFMPERMALELKGSERPLAPNADLRVEVNGRFLYGAPATGSPVQGQLYVRPLREAVTSLPGYLFGSVTEKLPSESLDFKEQLTDEQGQASLLLGSQWNEARSPLELIARVSLLESGGRPVTRRLTQAVWPADQLPGILPQFANGQVERDSLAAFRLVLADQQGRQLDSDGIQVRLVRERRDYYWSYSSSGGWRSRYNEKTYTVQQLSVPLKAGQPAQVEFPVQWGSYRIEVEDPRTGMVSSERFWAGYRWQDSSEDGGVRPDQVRLQLDKPAYQDGETAVVRIEAPHAGSGYLMLESGSGILWWQNIDVPENGLDVRVPLQGQASHDLYLSALVVRPGQADAQLTAKRAVGLLHLPLDREQRRLQVEVDAPQTMHPEQPLPMRVRVLDANGQPAANAQVLLSAVDAGVLNITSFATPDPWQAFFGRKGYAWDQYDIYGQLIDAANAGLARLRFGGDAALEQGGVRPKAHVRILSWQSEPLHTDADGWVSTQMAMPDFNGEVRLMAQAWTDDSFSSTDTAITVAAPLVAEMSLPRFLARGDHSRMALDLHNLTQQTQHLQLSLGNDHRVQLRQMLPDQLELAPGQRLVLPLEVSAMDTGTAKLELQLSGIQVDDETLPPLQRSWQLDVRSPWPGQSRRQTALLDAGQSLQLTPDWLHGLLPGSLSGRLSLSSQPISAMEDFVRNLYDYPYGCAEQTSSRLLPLLHLNADQLTAFIDKDIDSQAHQQVLQSALHHVLSMQRHDGSIGMWSADSSEDFWDTVYVADTLQRARELGVHVPNKAYERLLQRLQRYVREGHLINADYSDAPAHTRLAVQSYAALVLAREGKIALGALRSLHGRAADARSPLPLVQLAVALHQAGDLPKAQELLKQAAVIKRQPGFWPGDYGSPLSEAGWQLLLLQEQGLLDPQQRNPLLEQLVDHVQGQRWLSTQENAAVFMALQATGLNDRSPWQASVQLADRSQMLSQNQSSITLAAKQLTQPLELANPGEQPLYLSISARGDTAEYNPPPNQTLDIRRQYFHLDGSPAELDVSSGTLLLVHLEVTSSDYVRDALVVDLLPAGFELENQNLGESNLLLKEVTAFKRWHTAMQNSQLAMQAWMDDRYVAALSLEPHQSTHLLYLVRAVTPGQYQLPPAQVQSMYRPEQQASFHDNSNSELRVRSH